MSPLNDDERVTGDILSAILGRDPCDEGNSCLADEVALLVEAKDEEIKRLKRRVELTEEVALHLDRALRIHVDVRGGGDHRRDECPETKGGSTSPCVGCCADDVVEAALGLYQEHLKELSETGAPAGPFLPEPCPKCRGPRKFAYCRSGYPCPWRYSSHHPHHKDGEPGFHLWCQSCHYEELLLEKDVTKKPEHAVFVDGVCFLYCPACRAEHLHESDPKRGVVEPLANVENNLQQALKNYQPTPEQIADIKAKASAALSKEKHRTMQRDPFEHRCVGVSEERVKELVLEAVRKERRALLEALLAVCQIYGDVKLEFLRHQLEHTDE